MKTNIKDIKKLREETGAGVLDVKQALEKSKGDFGLARRELIKKGVTKAAKKSTRTVKSGLVHSYIHNNEKVGGMVMVACETDFVARTDDFKNLCHELAMQVCTDNYKNMDELLESDYLRDPNKKVSDVVTAAVAKLGEKIEIKDFVKFDVSDV